MAIDRNFTVENSEIGFEGGIYKAASPMSAGRKAGRMLFSMIKYGSMYEADSKKHAKYAKYAAFAKFAKKQKVKFVLRETTADSAKKTFTYEVTQEKLKEPVIVKRGDIEIKIERKFNIRSCKA